MRRSRSRWQAEACPGLGVKTPRLAVRGQPHVEIVFSFIEPRRERSRLAVSSAPKIVKKRPHQIPSPLNFLRIGLRLAEADERRANVHLQPGAAGLLRGRLCVGIAARMSGSGFRQLNNVFSRYRMLSW